MMKMRTILALIKSVFTKEFWSLKNAASSPRRMFFIKQFRIFSLAIRGFNEDRVVVRASALTYYTLLSIVPIAAMAFGVASGFGFEEKLTVYVNESFASQQDIAKMILEFANKYLSNIKGGVIAGIGVIILFWTVMRLLGSIELSFNDIWQIKKSRDMSRKMSDYISLIVIAPVLIVVSSGVTVFLNQQIKSSSDVFPLLGYIGPILSGLFSIIPFFLIWLVFTLLYIIMPNTKVKFSSAFTGGIIAGTMFQLFQFVYINFQSKLFHYGEVYGGFAVLPLFLVWLQTSWLIVLFGAEVAFANQNVLHYESESESINISHHLKRAVSLMIIKLIAANFRDSVKAMTAEEIADKLDLPIRLVRDIIYELIDVGIISETVTDNVKENAYQPAFDIQKLSISLVINTLDKRGIDNLSSENTEDLNSMIKLIGEFAQEIEKSKSNKLLVEL
jgi:membrane protein